MVIGNDDKDMLCTSGDHDDEEEDDGDEDVHLAPHLAGQGVDGLEGDGSKSFSSFPPVWWSLNAACTADWKKVAVSMMKIWAITPTMFIKDIMMTWMCCGKGLAT